MSRNKTQTKHTLSVLKKSHDSIDRLIEASDPVQAAQQADLVYISDDVPGFSRIKRRDTFIFVDESGNPIEDQATIDRLKSLAIPPAYRNVWISPLEDSHLQFTARDERGRKQYRYHTRWRTYRSQVNQARMIRFAHALPGIRKAIEQDLNTQGLHKTKVLATVIKLMDLTLIRVGNDEYAKTNDSYGLTTMRDKHVTIKGENIRFEFKGKSSKKHTIDLSNPRLARIVKRCMEVPGYELFQYYDQNGHKHRIDSSDVNEYLKTISGEDFTAKDFRTWWASVYAMEILAGMEPCDTKKLRKSNLVNTVKEVAKKLGNTPAVCKKNYIHPGLLASYESGELEEIIRTTKGGKNRQNISLHEHITLKFLEKTIPAELHQE